MLYGSPVRDSWRRSLGPEDLERMQDPDLRIRVSIPRSEGPAITHVDYSAKIQTVDPDRHDRFYRLMRHFYELTECPVIINTSFNIRGEPIVHSYENAYCCFMATDMDCLVLEDYLLLKKAQPSMLNFDREAYKAQFALD